MKTVFIFILGMLIAIFLLLPKNGDSSSVDSNIDPSTEFGQITIKKKEYNHVDRFIIGMAKSMISTVHLENDIDAKFKSKKQPTNYNIYY